MRRRTLVLIAGIILVLVGLALPVHVTCGAPGAACAVPPIPPSTRASYYYEDEPVGIMLLEMVTRSNIRVYYAAGQE